MKLHANTGFVIMPRLKFNNLKDKMIYMHLLEIANFVDSQECERGQCITSISRLSDETGWSYGIIRGTLNRLEESRFIKAQTLPQKRGIKVSICEYDRIQSVVSYKKEENKQYDKPPKDPSSEKTNAHAFYEKNVGMLNPLIVEKITASIEDFVDGDDVVIYAMEIAISKNKLNWTFIHGVLENWRKANLKTLDAIKADQERRMKQQHRFPSAQKPFVRKGVVPKWMNKEKPVDQADIKKVDDLKKRIERFNHSPDREVQI